MIDTSIATMIRNATSLEKEQVKPATEIIKINGQTVPLIVYTQLPGGQRRYCDQGNIGLTQARFQIDYFYGKETEARAAADLVRLAAEAIRKQDIAGTQIDRIRIDDERFLEGVKAEGANQSIARFIQYVIVEYRETVSN
jgi:hypothetical protein